MNCSGFGILIPFSKSVVLSKIVHLFIATDSNSWFSISIALHCVSAIICTFVDRCTSTCTSMDSCSYISTMLSSPVSFYIVYASTNCYSKTSSSSNSSMNTESTDAALGPICFLAHQCLFLLRKNLNVDVQIVSIC